MPVERTHGSACLIDVLDRVRDKGLVITGSIEQRAPTRPSRETEQAPRGSGRRPDLTAVRLRVVVAAVRTYLDDEERTRSVGQIGKSETSGTSGPEREG